MLAAQYFPTLTSPYTWDQFCHVQGVAALREHCKRRLDNFRVDWFSIKGQYLTETIIGTPQYICEGCQIIFIIMDRKRSDHSWRRINLLAQGPKDRGQAGLASWGVVTEVRCMIINIIWHPYYIFRLGSIIVMFLRLCSVFQRSFKYLLVKCVVF